MATHCVSTRRRPVQARLAALPRRIPDGQWSPRCRTVNKVGDGREFPEREIRVVTAPIQNGTVSRAS